MKYFKARDLTNHQNKKFLIGTVIPRPIALVVSLSDQGIVNLAPFSYFNIISFAPPLIAISVLRHQGIYKDTARNILSQGQATVHIVDKDIVEDANRASIELDSDTSELNQTSFTLIPSQEISVPSITQAKACFETQLYSHTLITNRDGVEISDLLILEVVHYAFSDAIIDLEKEYIAPNVLQPVSRLAGDTYAKLGSQFNLQRPRKDEES